MKKLLLLILILVSIGVKAQKLDTSKVFGPNGTLYHEVKKVLQQHTQNHNVYGSNYHRVLDRWETDSAINAECKYCFLGTLKPNKFVFGNIPDEMLSISAPDSAGYYLIKFAKSKVKFINDSTFTFKVTK